MTKVNCKISPSEIHQIFSAGLPHVPSQFQTHLMLQMPPIKHQQINRHHKTEQSKNKMDENG